MKFAIPDQAFLLLEGANGTALRENLGGFFCTWNRLEGEIGGLFGRNGLVKLVIPDHHSGRLG